MFLSYTAKLVVSYAFMRGIIFLSCMKSSAYRLAFLFLLATSCSTGTTNNSRAVYRGNPQLSGVYDEIPVYSLQRVKFSFQAQGPIRMMPSIADKILYFGSGNGVLYAIDAITGSGKWEFKTSGAIHSSPAIFKGMVYFSSRNEYLYALDSQTGKEKWKYKFAKDLEYSNGWDYYLSSPVVADGILYTGSGDGNLYAFDPATGKEIWHYQTGARIRTAPAVNGDLIFIGTMNGYLYAIEKKSGTVRWKFATKGIANKFVDFGYDATAIVSSPSVGDGTVVFGARDGILYAVDEKTGKEKWRNDHNGSWVLGTGIKNRMVFASSGSSAFVQALDIDTGKEIWRFKSQKAVFSSLTLAGDMLYFDDYGGNVYALNNRTGVRAWRFPMGRRSFSAPLISDGMIYCTSDDGILYALEGAGDKEFKPARPVKKIVYWEPPKTDSSFTWFQNGVDLYIRDYFRNAEYELVDGKSLEKFLKEQIIMHDPSIVLFANNEISYNRTENSDTSLLRRYPDAGGKIVFLGPDPTAMKSDQKNGIVYDSIDFTPDH